MLSVKDQSSKTLPGWRDFERSLALAFNGIAVESKWIYDVVLVNPLDARVRFGISCKMRNELRRVDKDGLVTIELSNAAGEMWGTLSSYGITNEQYPEHPKVVGEVILGLVKHWHVKEDVSTGGVIDTSKSCFLSLQWNRRLGQYQLFQFPVQLPDPAELHWVVEGRRLIGKQANAVVFEWYAYSGGQLKYYPKATDAVWHSNRFTLEPLPAELDFVLINKAASYYPTLWMKLQ